MFGFGLTAEEKEQKRKEKLLRKRLRAAIRKPMPMYCPAIGGQIMLLAMSIINAPTTLTKEQSTLLAQRLAHNLKGDSQCLALLNKWVQDICPANQFLENYGIEGEENGN